MVIAAQATSMDGHGMTEEDKGDRKDAMRPHILVVDDENGPRQALRLLLNEEYDVSLASDVTEALGILESRRTGVIVTDICMPGQSGIDLLREVKRRHSDVQVIILTGYAHVGTAIEAVEYDAFAYLEKPFDSDKMLEHVRDGFRKHDIEMERVEHERLTLEANRFETLGRLVSGMMHDLGTPLSVIGNNIEIIISDPERGDMKDRLKTMHSQAKHCNEMVRSAMAFLRSDSHAIEPFNINNVVNTCLDVARHMTRASSIEITTELSRDLGGCVGHVVMVRQAVLNLLTNACHAIEEQEGPRRVTIKTWKEEGQACLSVEDTGPGVPVEHRERIFETLFTTKGEKGTGLGLAVVRNVMARHNGTVTLAKRPEGGALFELSFPTASTKDLVRLLRKTAEDL